MVDELCHFHPSLDAAITHPAAFGAEPYLLAEPVVRVGALRRRPWVAGQARELADARVLSVEEPVEDMPSHRRQSRFHAHAPLFVLV
jgi:hypothetical protein